METMLVFGKSRLTPVHRERLQTSLPGEEIGYCDLDAAPEQLAGAEIIFGNPPPKLLIHCKKLRLLQLMSAGADGYLDAMPQGAYLANATGSYGLAVSEHMLAMLLHIIKKLHLYGRNMGERLWKDEGTVTSVYGAAVLVVGLGDIGGEFARRIHSLGGYTIGVRRVGRDKPDYLDELHSTDGLDELLPRADVVALCLPNTPQTTGLISRQRIGLLKPGAVLLNVGRGAAVDQEALVEALESGRIGGAGLDVTEPEPLPSSHPLWNAPNTIITPHVSGGGHLPETLNRIIDIAIQNIKAVRDGHPPKIQVDPSTGYRRL